MRKYTGFTTIDAMITIFITLTIASLGLHFGKNIINTVKSHFNTIAIIAYSNDNGMHKISDDINIVVSDGNIEITGKNKEMLNITQIEKESEKKVHIVK